MSSPTLEAILRHWTATLKEKLKTDDDILEDLEHFVLPFDVQSFCAENDATLGEARHLLANLIWAKGTIDNEEILARAIDFINLTSGV